MKKLFGWLFHPLVLAILGLVAAALIVWFVGPLIAIGPVRPLESETVRWIVIGAIVFVWLAKKAWGVIQAKRQNAKLMEGIAKPAAAPAAAPGQAEVAALDQRFSEAIAVLKQVRLSAAGKRPGIGDLLSLSGKQYLYQLPWYVFIGAPGSGKTTALVNSGLSFPLAEKFGTASIRGVGGTRNCDWWFTDEAVLLDTAGRYTTQESDREADAGAWQGFLQLLKKSRPRRPINGVLLTVSVADLLQQSGSEREAHATAVRARLQELHEQLQVRFPIYVLITKTDLLAGFEAFFAPLGKEERAQVWGITFAHREDGTLPLAGFGAEFDALQQRLIDRVLERMHAERDPTQRAAIHAFPQQFGNLKGLLGDFLDKVFAASKFEQAPLLRGVYFTSGTQEGSPIDRVMGTLARSLGLERKLVAPAAASGRSYFITTLLRQVIFAEQGLAGTNLRWERRRTFLQWGAYALALLLLAGAATAWLVSWSRNRAYVGEIEARLPLIQKQVEALPQASGNTDVVGLLPVLNSVNELATTSVIAAGGVPWSMGFGLFQGDKLAAASEQAYRGLLRDALLPRLANRVEAQVRSANPGNLEFAYEALKAYLMLHDGEHFDADALKAWIGFDWERNLPRELTTEQRAELDRHLATLLERGALSSPLPADQNLIASTRTMLARYPFANRVYSRVKRQGVGADIPEFTVAKAAGPAAPLVFVRASGQPLTQGVAGLYTFDGYHKAFAKAADEVTRQLAAEESWVLGVQGADGGPDLTRLGADVRRIYLTDYVKVWEEFIADVKLTRTPTLAQSIQQARVLSAPDNPLVPYLRAVVRETTLGQKQEAEKTVVDKAAERLKGTQAQLDKLLGGTPVPAAGAVPASRIESIVDDRFENLRRLVTPSAPGQPAPIDGAIAMINEVYTMLSAAETAVNSKVTPPPSPVTAKIKSDAPRLPEPLRTVLLQLEATGSAQVTAATRGTISSELGSTVGDFCKQAINGRYPFVRSSARDVLPDDFARLFAPGGIIEAFFQKNLADKVDTSTRPWSFKRVNDVSFGDPGSLVQFQRAQVIREVFFRGGGSGAALRLEFKPSGMDAAIDQFILDVDGQLVKYNHGPQVPQTVQWPGPKGSTQVRASIQPAGPSGVSAVTTEGPWALFRLFDKVQMEATAVPERFKASLVVDGRKAEFDIVASSVQNPFRLREIEQFQCPGGL